MPPEEKPRKLKIDIEDVTMAMDDASYDVNNYLDTETGQVIRVTQETRDQLEEIYENDELGNDSEEDSDLDSLLEEADLSEWEKEAIKEANDVENNFGSRYIAIPQADSHDGYEQMQEFAENVEDKRIADRLFRALGQKHPFRRFKDALDYYPEVQQQWYEFKNSSDRQKVLEWLLEEGIELIE
jgi:hypothetical protein